MAKIAQVQPSPPGADKPAGQDAPTARDLREELMPVDPLGLRPGEGSLAQIATSRDNARLAAIASSGAEPGLSLEARERARRQEGVTVILLLVGLALAVIWLYRRRGRSNFAGHGHNR